MRLIQLMTLLLLLVACGNSQNEAYSQITLCNQMATSEPLNSEQDGCKRVEIRNANVKQIRIKDGAGSLMVEVRDSKRIFYLGIKKTTVVFVLRADQTSHLVDVSAIAVGQLIDVLVDKDGVRASNPAQANVEEVLIK